jgi:ribosomal-protein-alanine N-acetyltransferase
LSSRTPTEPDPDAAASAPYPTLATPRLRLRPLAVEDMHALHAAFDDAEAMRFMDFPRPQSLDDTARYLSTHLFVMPDWHACWVLEFRATGAVIGFINYHHRENWNARLEIGFFLARAFWGRGIMTEAITALLNYCFHTLAMERVEITTTPENAAAIKLAEHLGFQREGGPMRRRQRVGSEYRDLLMFGLLRDEWQSRTTV